LMRALHASGRRADALEVYQRTRERMSEELGLEPSEELVDLQQTMLSSSTPTRPASPPGSHNLPTPATSLIGRRDDVEGVRAALQNARMVTLVGTGGVGKTRLAIALGHAVLDEFPDGVWLVDLSGVSDPALVAAETAHSLDVKEHVGRPVIETLTGELKSRRVMLILDNCEHLVDVCAELSDLLIKSCPHLRLVATSREPLDVPGESLWRVRSLTVPLSDDTGIEMAMCAESVQLFVDRGNRVGAGFEIDEKNVAAVAVICRRLDGVALALELAAARLRTMTVTEIGSRLDDRFRLLTAGARTALPRQQTLEATIAWSYDLLEPAERLLFGRLAVFAGGFSLEAAESVCADDLLAAGDVLDLTSRLVDRSMVTTNPSLEGRTRHGLLETLRQFGWERLVELGAAWAAELAQATTTSQQLSEEVERRTKVVVLGDRHRRRAAGV
jgi:predicted ATPase